MACPTPLPPFPGFIPVADCARTVMRYSCFGQTVENVWYFERSGGYDATALDDLNGAITTAWAANLRPFLPPQLVLEDITSTAIHTSPGAQDIDAVATAGSNAGAAFNSLGSTFVIKFGTALAGRSFRGRMYVPALVGVEVLNNLLSATYAGNLRDSIADMFADILADTGDQHVVVSYVTDCEWRDNGVATPVTSYSYTDRNIDSQRRRLSGRGI